MSNDQYSVKFRPQTLDEFIGNKTAIAYIKGLQKGKRIPNCLLICGSSGTGKTTLARLAACLFSGWKEHPDKNPDIIELQSNVESGKDDVRNAIEQSRYAPRGGKRRCMIADEAHAYTGQAASALLKACEEPPPKTTWILCTDKPEKLPRQLLMRAQQIALTNLSDAETTELVNWIITNEKLNLGAKQKLIVKKIVESSYGVPRQAVQLLDSVATSMLGGAQASEALKMAIKSGSSLESFETGLMLIQYYLDNDANKCISIINACKSEGVLELMLRMLAALIYKANGNNMPDGFGWATVKTYKGRVDLHSLLTLQARVIELVKMRIESNYSLTTETLLLRLVRIK